ncbi:MAG: type II toxin-antitoxin system HicB family antitoxin [Candidatus Pararuminococcus gallinarum]|jgi:predicted RNase H-like HicB family nuclease
MTLAYAACFYPEEQGYSVIVPDFNAATQGDDLKEAVYMTEDLIAGLILTAIEDGKSFPKPSTPSNNMLEPEEYGENGFVSVVLVDLDKKEKEFKEQNRAVKKTLTIPYWVNERALAMNINFSQTLTDALIEKFN